MTTKLQATTASPPFVVVEGLDGVGKTTLARALSGALCGTYVRTPPHNLSAAAVGRHSSEPRLRAHVERQGSSASRCLFYALGVALVSDSVRDHHSRGAVVCDRYLLSTLVYHELPEPLAQGLTTDFGLAVPDITFLLTADEGIRRTRVVRRGLASDACEYGLGEDSDAAGRLLARYRRYGADVEIDTTHRLPDDVLGEALGILRERSIAA